MDGGRDGHGIVCNRFEFGCHLKIPMRLSSKYVELYSSVSKMGWEVGASAYAGLKEKRSRQALSGKTIFV
jgi:hypothetical protein